MKYKILYFILNYYNFIFFLNQIFILFLNHTSFCNLNYFHIPPSKPFLVWRLMHDKLSTDKNLKSLGCNIPSMCSSLTNCTESTFHLFFECSFALKLWSWLATMLNTTLQLIHCNSWYLAFMWQKLDSSVQSGNQSMHHKSFECHLV